MLVKAIILHTYTIHSNIMQKSTLSKNIIILTIVDNSINMVSKNEFFSNLILVS